MTTKNPDSAEVVGGCLGGCIVAFVWLGIRLAAIAAAVFVVIVVLRAMGVNI